VLEHPQTLQIYQLESLVAVFHLMTLSLYLKPMCTVVAQIRVSSAVCTDIRFHSKDVQAVYERPIFRPRCLFGQISCAENRIPPTAQENAQIFQILKGIV
jgi:hypothetical protein